MLTEMNEIEARIVGCLVEKQLTTPEYYPLTLNALVAACNQKTNRDPVTSYAKLRKSNARSIFCAIKISSMFFTAVRRVCRNTNICCRRFTNSTNAKPRSFPF